jgi:transcriptional regulator
MYIPGAFGVDDEGVRELLSQIQVGELVTATASGPLATLLPWVVDLESGCMLAHMARPNPQWQTPWLGRAMVIATGPNGYVSPSWYPSKAEHGRVVPTWNYVTVHVHGELTVQDDSARVDELVRLLTDRHESGRTEPWGVDDAPGAYVEGQLRAIVGLEFRIDHVEAKVKMSQNKSESDVAGVVAGLRADDEEELAEWVTRANS